MWPAVTINKPTHPPIPIMYFIVSIFLARPNRRQPAQRLNNPKFESKFAALKNHDLLKLSSCNVCCYNSTSPMLGTAGFIQLASDDVTRDAKGRSHSLNTRTCLDARTNQSSWQCPRQPIAALQNYLICTFPSTCCSRAVNHLTHLPTRDMVERYHWWCRIEW